MARFFGREIDQQSYERWIGQLFADAFNKLNGTDYIASSATRQNDSVDVIMQSRSGKYTSIPIQITDSRPSELQRFDSNKVELGEKLSSRLIKKGFESHHVSFPAPELPDKKEITALCDKLEDFIAKKADPSADKIIFGRDDIWEYFHESPPPFGTVTILKVPGLNRCDVNPATAHFIPPSKESIKQALRKKVKARYSDEEKLWLVIVDASFTDSPSDVSEYLGETARRFERTWFLTFGPNNTAQIFEI